MARVGGRGRQPKLIHLPMLILLQGQPAKGNHTESKHETEPLVGARPIVRPLNAQAFGDSSTTTCPSAPANRREDPGLKDISPHPPQKGNSSCMTPMIMLLL